MLYHVSFEEIERLTPRIPKQRCPGENDTIPRICVSDSILHAVRAIPQAGKTLNYMLNRLHISPVIHVYLIEEKHLEYSFINYKAKGNRCRVLISDEIATYVPDARVTHECWLLDEPYSIVHKVYRINRAQLEDYTDMFDVQTIYIENISYEEIEDGNNADLMINNFPNEDKRAGLRDYIKKFGFRSVASIAEEAL